MFILGIYRGEYAKVGRICKVGQVINLLGNKFEQTAVFFLTQYIQEIFIGYFCSP